MRTAIARPGRAERSAGAFWGVGPREMLARPRSDRKDAAPRIAEGMTERRCNGRVGHGLSEYLDQIVDRRPTGADLPAKWTAR